jgi:uncharacterized RDD family membrane protein YckC
MSNNFYFNIYSKKTSEELKEIVGNINSADDSKIIAIDILETRTELTDEFRLLRNSLVNRREEIKHSEIADGKYQTFLPRFFAMIIDGIIISLIGYVNIFFANIESVILIKILQFFLVFLPYAYSIILHGLTGQTLGKMFTNVRIYDKSEKNIIGFKQALLRDLVPLIGIFVLYVVMLFEPSFNVGLLLIVTLVFSYLMLSRTIIEIITMMFNSKRRALHDFIAGTVVLKIKD